MNPMKGRRIKVGTRADLVNYRLSICYQQHYLVLLLSPFEHDELLTYLGWSFSHSAVHFYCLKSLNVFRQRILRHRL